MDSIPKISSIYGINPLYILYLHACCLNSQIHSMVDTLNF